MSRDPELMPPDDDANDFTLATWEENKHHRGQPGNKGQFGPGGNSGAAPAAKKPAAGAAAPSPAAVAKPARVTKEGSKVQAAGSTIAREPKTPPPPGSEYKPDVEAKGADGITKAARIGVPAMSVPPPPPVAHLPNLTPYERMIETSFMDKFHADPDGMAGKFLEDVKRNTKAGDPPTFGTDDAKALSSSWTHEGLSPESRSNNRATLNCALHQTANAICKRAFLKHLDTLKTGDGVMVTVGGCGAGKGYSLGKVPEALALKNAAKAVWDSAGDQNATENPWIQQEAEKRGLKVTYAFVHADPKTQWAHPERGVVKRAEDPKDGRMVDSQVFADSYALGAKNHQAFFEKNKDNPNAQFVFLSNGAKIPGVPPEALSIDRKELARFAQGVIMQGAAPPHIKRGALIGRRIWGAGS